MSAYPEAMSVRAIVRTDHSFAHTKYKPLKTNIPPLCHTHELSNLTAGAEAAGVATKTLLPLLLLSNSARLRTLCLSR